MIEASGLRRTFGKVVAVDDVSFRAEDGRVTALLGPNGAGKSTTLRILYTMIDPTGGSARVNGIDTVADPLGVRRVLGVLPHNAGIYQRLTARENVRYFGRLNDLTDDQIDERIEGLADLLDMRSFLDRRAKGFSQGQRLKTALARALIHEPANIVLDEPTNGLDVMATRALREIISNLAHAGKCVLFSSHIMQEVASLCDDIVIIAAGRVRAAGSADEIRAQTGEPDLEDAFVRAVERAAETDAENTAGQAGSNATTDTRGDA
ncbi:MAG: ATP-binding cassette domain-containing protein [Pseudomonadota bacterium]